jgi:sialic acid synthase SpsE
LSKGLTEKKSILFRRTLNDVKNLKAGDVLTKENLRAIRPGLGLPTKYLEVMLGQRVLQNVDRGTALVWEILK